MHHALQQLLAFHLLFSVSPMCALLHRLVHLWDATTHQQLPSWPGHRASVNQVRVTLHTPLLCGASPSDYVYLMVRWSHH